MPVALLVQLLGECRGLCSTAGCCTPLCPACCPLQCCKIRLADRLEDTIELTKMLESSGCDLLTGGPRVKSMSMAPFCMKGLMMYLGV